MAKKKRKIIFPPPLPAILLPESLDLKKKIFMSHRSPKKIGPTHRKNPTLNSCFKNKNKKIKEDLLFPF